MKYYEMSEIDIIIAKGISLAWSLYGTYKILGDMSFDNLRGLERRGKDNSVQTPDVLR